MTRWQNRQQWGCVYVRRVSWPDYRWRRYTWTMLWTLGEREKERERERRTEGRRYSDKDKRKYLRPNEMWTVVRVNWSTKMAPRRPTERRRTNERSSLESCCRLWLQNVMVRRQWPPLKRATLSSMFMIAFLRGRGRPKNTVWRTFSLLPEYTTDPHIKIVYCTITLPVCLTWITLYILSSVIALWWPRLCFNVLCHTW